MWARNGNLAGYMTWNSAIDYANNLTLCGYSDWSLPNVNELESLVNTNLGFYFYNVQPVYWSSTTIAYDSNLAWEVNVAMSNVIYDYKFIGTLYHVLPVRSGQIGIIQLPKTG